MTSKMLLDQTRSKARDVARALAWSSADAVENKDSTSLLAVAEEMLTESELCYVLFTDVSGQLITSYQRGAGNINHLLMGPDGQISVEPIDSPKLTVHREYGTRVDIVYPVRPLRVSHHCGTRPTVGYIRVGLDATRYEARLGYLSYSIMRKRVGAFSNPAISTKPSAPPAPSATIACNNKAKATSCPIRSRTARRPNASAGFAKGLRRGMCRKGIRLVHGICKTRWA